MKHSEELNFGTVQNLKWNILGKDKKQGKGLIKVEQGGTTMGKQMEKG